MTSWALALAIFVLGVAAGPVLDRLARRSLGEPEDVSWRHRGIATGLVAGGFGAAAVMLVPTPSIAPAWIALAFVAAGITRTDLARHRIPDAWNLLALASGATLLVIPVDAAAYGRAWLAALAVTAALLALALIGPTGLGMGDVKLGPTLGLYLGFLSWEAVIIGLGAGFVLGALAGLALVARDALGRRSIGAALKRSLPFGPFLLLGTLVGLAV